MINICNEGKLNAFQPVRIPKVKDIFKRRGFLDARSERHQSMDDLVRNPLEARQHIDSNFARYQNEYEDYSREQAESVKKTEPEAHAD